MTRAQQQREEGTRESEKTFLEKNQIAYLSREQLTQKYTALLKMREDTAASRVYACGVLIFDGDYEAQGGSNTVSLECGCPLGCINQERLVSYALPR